MSETLHDGGMSLVSMVMKHEKELYHENGKKSLMTRMSSGEERLDRAEKAQASTEKMFWAIILLLVTILGGVVAQSIKGHDAPSAPHATTYND